MTVQTTTFKGARYIVKFHDPIEWADTESYEAIEAVQHEAFTYISKQPVPAGVQIDNEEFWLLWADPNAQMEQLRQLVSGYVDDVSTLDVLVNAINDALPISDFDNVNTVKNAINGISSIIPASDFNAENTVKSYIDDKVEKAIFNGQQINISKYGRMVGTSDANAVPGQSCCYYDHHYYLSEPGNIAVFDEEGHFVSHNGAASIGHGNDIAVNATHLIVADGSAPKLYVFNPSTLALIKEISFVGVLSNVFACTTDEDENVYFNGYYPATQSTNVLFKIDVSTEEYEEIAHYDQPSTGQRQGCCVFENCLYAFYTAPNIILKINLENSELLKTYIVPDGDTLFPLAELEKGFVKDNDIILFSSWRYTGFAIGTVTGSNKASLSMLWKTNIVNDVVPANKNEIFTTTSKVIIVNPNADYVFNPIDYNGINTAIEASAIACYLKTAEIRINGNSLDTLQLSNGQYNVRRVGGDRKVENVYIENSNVTLDGFDFNNVFTAVESTIYASRMALVGNFTLYRSHAIFNDFYIADNVGEISLHTSELEINEITNYPVSFLPSMPTSDFIGNTIKITAQYLPGLYRIANTTRNFARIMGQSNALFFSASIGQSNISSENDFVQAAFGNNGTDDITELHFKPSTGKIYTYDGNTETELPSDTTLTIYSSRRG